MRISGYVALALLLTACAGSGSWTKQGVSRSQAAQDYADCRREASDSTKRDVDIDSDILTTRSHDWENSRVLAAKRSNFALQDQGESDRLVASCMIGNGYAPGE
ncbi:MAG TPA: hypothetical protein VKT70_06955 [Stellaceae bacterium]|nr:hypothetical protein [Stellaceae bacterium]